MGASEVINRRRADEDGLVHAAGETAGSGEASEITPIEWEQGVIMRRRENERGLVHVAGKTAGPALPGLDDE